MGERRQPLLLSVPVHQPRVFESDLDAALRELLLHAHTDAPRTGRLPRDAIVLCTGKQTFTECHQGVSSARADAANSRDGATDVLRTALGSHGSCHGVAAAVFFAKETCSKGRSGG